MNRDLYQILGVPPEAGEEEVKRAYRRIALAYHPDRNLGSMQAEDRFKEANYAYSILGRRERRKRYDLYREFVRHSTRWGLPASPSQERILTDLFLEPKLPGLARWLDELLRMRGLSGEGGSFRDFSRATFQFLRQVLQEERKREGARKKRRRRPIVFFPKTILRKVGSTFVPFGAPSNRGNPERTGPREGFSGTASGRHRGADIEWTLPLTREEAEQGTRLTVSFFRDSRWDRLALLVPPNTREGVRLRVRKKGNRIASSGETGDLYFRVLIR